MADVPPMVIRRRPTVVANVGSTSALRHANVQFDVGMIFCRRRHDVGTNYAKITANRGPTSALHRLAYGEGSDASLHLVIGSEKSFNGKPPSSFSEEVGEDTSAV